MIDIKQLSVGDKVLLYKNIKHVVSDINPASNWISLVEKDGDKVSISKHISNLSRIPVTVDNFPKDGLVWCERDSKVISVLWNNMKYIGNYYLPFKKDLERWEKANISIVRDCTTCKHKWEFAIPTGTLTTTDPQTSPPIDKITIRKYPNGYSVITPDVTYTGLSFQDALDRICVENEKLQVTGLPKVEV